MTAAAKPHRNDSSSLGRPDRDRPERPRPTKVLGEARRQLSFTLVVTPDLTTQRRCDEQHEHGFPIPAHAPAYQALHDPRTLGPSTESLMPGARIRRRWRRRRPRAERRARLRRRFPGVRPPARMTDRSVANAFHERPIEPRRPCRPRTRRSSRRRGCANRRRRARRARPRRP